MLNIINKSVHVINYETNSIITRDIPDNFNDYISELVDHINSNEKVRDYKSKTNTTQILIDALRILEKKDEGYNFKNNFDNIANRLLETEVKAQNTVKRLQTNVKKGSLIQALIFNTKLCQFSFLLAKVEHSNFIDDTDFSFKTGFSKDKKTIWKSCLIDLSNPDADIFDAKIYSDTNAKYWSEKFLEFEEIQSDELNTKTAFKEIEKVLNRSLKNIAYHDYTIIRNSVISYFRSHEYIKYDEMVEDIFSGYVPDDTGKFTQEHLNQIISKISDLPKIKHFDYQFISVPSAIDARMKKTYKVYDGIELKILHDIDIGNTIVAFQDNNGERYITIKTDDDLTYNAFKK